MSDSHSAIAMSKICSRSARLVAGVDEVLAGSAFMFSNLWLDDVLRRAPNPSLPRLQNTDGEPLEFITVHHFRWSRIRIRGRSKWRCTSGRPCGRRATPSGTGSRRRRRTGSSQRDRRPIPGPLARRSTTAPLCLAPSNSDECGHVVGQLGSPGRSRTDAALTGSCGARARSPTADRQNR